MGTASLLESEEGGAVKVKPAVFDHCVYDCNAIDTQLTIWDGKNSALSYIENNEHMYFVNSNNWISVQDFEQFNEMKKKGKQVKAPTAVSDVTVEPKTKAATKPKQKRAKPDSTENAPASRKMPKRAASCTNFKSKPVRLSEKDATIENKKVQVVEEEIAAISLIPGPDDPRPNRRLTDFVFHNADGQPQPVEMLEVDDIFISGVILPLEKASDKEKESGVRCEGFGRIEDWSISGYEDGSPVIWVSTDLADYDCVKPAASYKKLFGLFYEKAHACVEVYKRLSNLLGATRIEPR
ncbi:hypothetical protein OSB04_012015 [Centaurea solstitialis]|uniref:RFTS domain-containing protein n=1 Tax=Centaurea solstitialis TaxID=347529 RepID=A0AA38TNM9_9ASTR|nr:hypothetical protein OSB04_012015 [Centaurea solstitialis]